MNMLHIGITHAGKEKERLRLLKLLSPIFIAFLITAFVLPIAFFMAFYFGLIEARSPLASLEEAVGRISYSSPNQGDVVGTGFLVSPKKIMTARHVVEGREIGDMVEVAFENASPIQAVQAEVIWKAPSEIPAIIKGKAPLDYFLTDVAVLELASSIDNIEPLNLGISEEVKTLDEVVLIGYPGGDYSITRGEINSLKYKDLNLFKLDATSNSGNSGGPCILLENKSVVGILVGGPISSEIDGENIAIKIDDVISLINGGNVEL